MEIHHKIEFVSGPFETDTGRLVAVKSHKHRSVELCFDAGMNVPFADIKLHTRDRYHDARDTFPSACTLGEEIARRWNAHLLQENPEAGEQSAREMRQRLYPDRTPWEKLEPAAREEWVKLYLTAVEISRSPRS